MNKIETSGHIHWVDNGILHIFVKPGNPSIERLDEMFNSLEEYGKKMPILIDPREGTALDKNQRKYVSQILNKYATAAAMLDNNLFVPIVFKFVKLNDKPDLPLRIFKDESKAIKWLNNYK